MDEISQEIDFDAKYPDLKDLIFSPASLENMIDDSSTTGNVSLEVRGNKGKRYFQYKLVCFSFIFRLISSSINYLILQ
jgi:hypothetical protein